jgi:hypothetical protein
MEFCLAVLLVLGKAGLNEFQDEIVSRPDVQDMLSRVEFYNNPAADAAGLDKMRSLVEATLKDGRTYSGAGDFAKGSPENPLSFDGVPPSLSRVQTMPAYQNRAPLRLSPRLRAWRRSMICGLYSMGFLDSALQRHKSLPCGVNKCVSLDHHGTYWPVSTRTKTAHGRGR